MDDISCVAPEDYDELLEVWEAAVRATHDFLTEADILTLKPSVRHEYFPLVRLFCVREDEPKRKILGFLGLSDDKVEMLFIRPAARGRGIGRRLMHFAIHEKSIRLVDVNEQNPQAVGFYEHLGFRVISRSPVDGQGRPFPLLHLELTVDKPF